MGEGSDVRSDGSAATPEDRRAKLRVHSGAAPGGSTRSTALRVLSLKQFRYLIRQALDLTGGVHSWSSGHCKMFLPLSQRQESAQSWAWLPQHLTSGTQLDQLFRVSIGFRHSSWCVTCLWCYTLAALLLPRESIKAWSLSGAGFWVSGVLWDILLAWIPWRSSCDLAGVSSAWLG